MRSLLGSEENLFVKSDHPMANAFQTPFDPIAPIAAVQKMGFGILDLAIEAENEAQFFVNFVAELGEVLPFYQVKVAIWDAPNQALRWIFDSQDGDLKRQQACPAPSLEPEWWAYVNSRRVPLRKSSTTFSRIQDGLPSGSSRVGNDWLLVPLLSGWEVGGALLITSLNASSYTVADERLMAEIARYFCQGWKICISSIQKEAKVTQLQLMSRQSHAALSQERKSRRKSELLQKILLKIAEATDASDGLVSRSGFFCRIQGFVGEFIESDRVYLAVFNGNGKEPPPQGSPLQFYPDWDLGPTNLGKVVHTLGSGNEERISLKVHLLRGLVSQHGIPLPDMGIIPLRFGGKSLGGIAYQFPLDIENSEELVFLLAQFVASAIARFQACERMQNVQLELEERVQNRTLELSTANVVLEQEIEERGRMERRLIHEVLHDPLTGLPNRTLFMDRLNLAFAKWSESRTNDFAVLFLDLDRFKVINDSLGHLQGDKLLKEVATRVKACTRYQDTVARLGGDEFAILLEGIQGIDDAKIIAARICTNLELPIELDGIQAYSSVSIGIAVIHPRYESASNLLRDADAAMYRAKARGRRQWVVFDESMHHQAMSVLSIESDLRVAFAKHEFQVAYQPIVCLRTGRIMAFEALVRWHHSEKGLIMPGQFIPLAEETGLIIALDWCVFKMACLQLVAWKKTIPETEHLKVSINLSSKHFTRVNIAAKILDALADTGLDPHFLKLEITETVLLDNFPSVQTVFQELQKMGVEILLDDFGTGFSSLNYLHRFPVDCLKIDRSFVSKLDQNSESKVIVRSIGGLAEGLNIKVVAEGIENQAQFEQLASWGCDYGQGYWISRPLTSENAAELLISGGVPRSINGPRT